MKTKEYIAEIRGPMVRKCTRAVRWYDWLPVLRLFLGIVWRKWDEGYRLSAATAWNVANSVHGIKS